MKKIILLACIICQTVTTFAQKKEKYYNEEVMPKYTISVHPSYLFSNGLRFDFEKQLGSPNKWLQVTATGYYASDYDSDDGYDDGWINFNTSFDTPIQALKGAGLGVAYKEFFTKKKTLYYSAGLYYTHYDVKIKEYGYYPFTENGLTFYEGLTKNIDIDYDKINANIVVGVQTSPAQGLFCDFFVGAGYAYSFYNKPYLNKNQFEYGYRGLQIVGGFRMGIGFGKP